MSVVIPSFQGAATIGATLRSLATQTLPADQFEIIVVQNGEPDHTIKIISEVCDAHPNLRVRRLELLATGAGLARNAGMAMARGAYTAFVDDDDVVSADYLAALLACSSATTVGVAQVADVQEFDSTPDFGNRLATQLPLGGRTLPPGQAVSALTYTWGKLLPTELARSVGFDPHLRSGEDIVFYLRLFTRYSLDLQFVPLDSHAVYYRSVIPGSLSRQRISYDFNINQRLDVIECLESLEPAMPWHQSAIRARTAAQARRMNEFLSVRPYELPRVLRDICQRGLRSIPADILLRGVHHAAQRPRTEPVLVGLSPAVPQLSLVG